MKHASLVYTVPCHCTLGESVIYSDNRQQVIWVDIEGKAIHTLDWEARKHAVVKTASRICWVKEDKDGKFIGGFENKICRLNADFSIQEVLWNNSAFPDNVRLNDAKTDRTGQLYFGTMDNDEKTASGGVFLFKGRHDHRLIQSGFIVSNGPAFSVTGQFMYTVSSAERIVFRLTLSSSGDYIQPVPFIRFDEASGWPDGLTVDAQDNLWIAVWGGTALFKFDSEGRLVDKLNTLALLTTSVAFVGPDKNFIAVTSALRGMSSEDLTLYPQSGNLFIYDVAETGLAEIPVKLHK